MFVKDVYSYILAATGINSSGWFGIFWFWVRSLVSYGVGGIKITEEGGSPSSPWKGLEARATFIGIRGLETYSLRSNNRVSKGVSRW